MTRRRILIPISILLFLALVLVGTYSHCEGTKPDTVRAEPPTAAVIPLLDSRVEDMTMSPDGKLGWLAMGLSPSTVQYRNLDRQMWMWPRD